MLDTLHPLESQLDRAEFRLISERAGIELYRAHIVRHAFEPHAHPGFGLGAIEHGVERFRYNGSDLLAATDSIVLMQPDVLHTGRAETASGWRYHMLYIEPDVLEEISGESGWWFPNTVIANNAAMGRRFSRLLQTLWHAQDPLAFDSVLLQVIEAVRPYSQSHRVAPHEAAQRFAPVLDYMQAHLGERIILEDLAAVAGLSRFHFLRQFQAQFHVTPHQMLMARRLHTAKHLLTEGLPPAEVAASVGLTDQAHLNRSFVCRYGVTPARYQRQVRQ
jgi:AraC-like DNA-binding protein